MRNLVLDVTQKIVASKKPCLQSRGQFYDKNYKLKIYELVNKLSSFDRKKFVSLVEITLGYFH